MEPVYEEEIDLKEIFQKLAEFWWVIILLTFLSGAVAYHVSANRIVPVYEARTTLFVGKESGSLPQLSLNDLNLGDRLVVDYRELVKTNLVLEEVIEMLSLQATPNQLRDKINVRTVNNSRFIYLSVQDTSPEMAVSIADALSDVLREKAEEVVGVQNVYVVDYAVMPQNPISPRVALNVAIALVLGMMVGVFIVFLNMYLNDTIEKESDIEQMVGLPVVGMIPKFKGDPR